MDENKKFICKYCKVQVLGREDFRPILGKVHLKHCKRKNIR